MKHASPQALINLADLLARIRAAGAAVPGFVEKKPGIYYLKGAAFLHFHEDAEGLFADAKTSEAADGFERFRVVTAREQAALMKALRKTLASRVSR
jgi:hypothetical protein